MITPGSRHAAASICGALAAGLVLTGCGGSGPLRATPARVDLGEIPFGGAPALVSITVENRAAAAILIQFFRIDGDTPAQVAPRASSCAIGEQLAAKGSCTVVVTLQADRFGSIKGRLVVGYKDKSSPLTVTVVATGGGKPALQVMTHRLDFGSHGVGDEPASAPVTLSSHGTAAAWLDQYTIEGPDAASFSIDAAAADCTISRIAPGTTCHLPIVFHSATSTRRRAVLVLTSKSADANGKLREATFRVQLWGGG